MHKPDEIAPVIAVLDGRNGPLTVETPDFVEDRLQSDAVLIGRPEFDLRVREGGRDRAEERSELFLNASCSAGSVCTWQGRGLRRLPSSRTRYAQPSCTLTGRPSRALIHSATVRPSQSSPSGAGPRTAAAKSASWSGASSGWARCEWV